MRVEIKICHISPFALMIKKIQTLHPIGDLGVFCLLSHRTNWQSNFIKNAQVVYYYYFYMSFSLLELF